jgi:hypothetical protein
MYRIANYVKSIIPSDCLLKRQCIEINVTQSSKLHTKSLELMESLRKWSARSDEVYSDITALYRVSYRSVVSHAFSKPSPGNADFGRFCYTCQGDSGSVGMPVKGVGACVSNFRMPLNESAARTQIELLEACGLFQSTMSNRLFIKEAVH